MIYLRDDIPFGYDICNADDIRYADVGVATPQIKIMGFSPFYNLCPLGHTFMPRRGGVYHTAGIHAAGISFPTAVGNIIRPNGALNGGRGHLEHFGSQVWAMRKTHNS